MFRPEAETASQPAARHVVRGIYGDELNAKVRAEGVDVDERTDQIPRFGATDYLPLDEGQLQQQFRLGRGSLFDSIAQPIADESVKEAKKRGFKAGNPLR